MDEVMKQYQYANNVFHAHLTQTKKKSNVVQKNKKSLILLVSILFVFHIVVCANILFNITVIYFHDLAA